MRSRPEAFRCRLAALAVTWLTTIMNAAPSPGILLFDFQAGISPGAWQIVNDDVMGGVSTSRFQVLTNGALFSGVLSLEHNGGFASVRSAPGRHNLDGVDAFILRVRGDGRRYKFTVRSETGFDSPLYQYAFTTKRGEWEDHRLPFKDFVPTFRGRVLTSIPPLDPAAISSMGFLIADGRRAAFRLEIASIRAVVEDGTTRQE